MSMNTCRLDLLEGEGDIEGMFDQVMRMHRTNPVGVVIRYVWSMLMRGQREGDVHMSTWAGEGEGEGEGEVHRVSKSLRTRSLGDTHSYTLPSPASATEIGRGVATAERQLWSHFIRYCTLVSQRHLPPKPCDEPGPCTSKCSYEACVGYACIMGWYITANPGIDISPQWVSAK